MARKIKPNPAVTEAQTLAQTSGLPFEACYQLLNPDREEDTVGIIKQHLRTEEQRRRLAERDITIEDLLNGRVEGDQSIYDDVFSVWNEKLGRKMFGF